MLSFQRNFCALLSGCKKKKKYINFNINEKQTNKKKCQFGACIMQQKMNLKTNPFFPLLLCYFCNFNLNMMIVMKFPKPKTKSKSSFSRNMVARKNKKK